MNEPRVIIGDKLKILNKMDGLVKKGYYTSLGLKMDCLRLEKQEIKEDVEVLRVIFAELDIQLALIFSDK